VLRVIAVLLLAASVASAQQPDWESAEDQSDQGPRDEPRPDSDADSDSDSDSADEDDEEDEAEEEDEEDEAEEDEAEEGGGFEDAFGEDLIGEFEHSLVGTLDLGLFVGEFQTQSYNLSGFAIAPLFGIAYQITTRIRAGAKLGFVLMPHGEVGFVGSPTPGDGGLAFRLANPLLHGDWLATETDFRVRIGGGITLPFAAVGDTPEVAALQVAAGMRGAWDLWLWAPSRLSIVVTGHLDYSITPDVVLGADAGVAGMIWVGDGSREFVFVGQIAANLEYVSEPIAAGGRISFVILGEEDLSFPDREELELSIMPYVRIELTDAYLLAGLTFNLTPPFGVSFIDGNPWGLRLGAGFAL
jgi:hypothetical protein